LASVDAPESSRDAQYNRIHSPRLYLADDGLFGSTLTSDHRDARDALNPSPCVSSEICLSPRRVIMLLDVLVLDHGLEGVKDLLAVSKILLRAYQGLEKTLGHTLASPAVRKISIKLLFLAQCRLSTMEGLEDSKPFIVLILSHVTCSCNLF